MFKKMMAGLLSLAVIAFSGVAFAATSGNKNTVYMKVKTQANWYKPGRESITLMSGPVGGIGLNGGHVYGIYRVELDGNFYGMLGESGNTLYIRLGRNKTHTITVAYDAGKTEDRYKKMNKGMRLSGNPHWFVTTTHKVADYW